MRSCGLNISIFGLGGVHVSETRFNSKLGSSQSFVRVDFSIRGFVIDDRYDAYFVLVTLSHIWK